MAFERIKTVKGHKYKYLVENTRINGKVKQKVLKYLGKVEADPVLEPIPVPSAELLPVGDMPERFFQLYEKAMPLLLFSAGNKDNRDFVQELAGYMCVLYAESKDEDDTRFNDFYASVNNIINSRMNTSGINVQKFIDGYSKWRELKSELKKPEQPNRATEKAPAGLNGSTVVYIDGGCEPINPGGTATYAFRVYDGSGKVHEAYGVVGEGPAMSNNVAEYAALVAAFKWLLEQGIKENIIFKGDSSLVINQMKGLFKAKSGLYLPKYYEAKNLAKNFNKIDFDWLPEEAHPETHNLTKKAYEEHCRKKGIKPKYRRRKGR